MNTHAAARPMSVPRDRHDERATGRRYASDFHVPVLAEVAAGLLVTDPAGVYVDGTLGGGGHSAAILDRLGLGGRVIGIDRDPEALQAATRRLAAEVERGRLRVIHGNFAQLNAHLRGEGHAQVEGILLDLGMSSHQVDVPTRGFAFSAEGPLDMRMDPTGPTTAAELVNERSQAELALVLREFGEEPRAHKIARAIVHRRPLRTTAELADVVRAVVPVKEEVKSLARVFQALRMAVNEELDALEQALIASLRLLRPGGRLAVIAYHSLEDRPVKQFFRYGNFENEPVRDFYGNLLTPWRPLTRKPLQAGEAELHANPRARSARLRVAEKRDPRESGLGHTFDY